MKKAVIKVTDENGTRVIRDIKGDITARDSEKETTLKVIEDIKRNSITPATMEERVFQEDMDSLCYTDKYTAGENSVMRFGLNINSSKILSNICAYDSENDIKKLIAEGKIPVGHKADSTNLAASSTSTASKPPLINLCVQEKELLQRATDYLLHTEERSAVLVDILARDRNSGDEYGAAIVKDGVLDVHTVVLYKNPSDDTGAAASAASGAKRDVVLVIDPSNFAFSSHLSQFISANSAHNMVTIAPTAKTQLYKAAGQTGPGCDEYRDCTDIAAKIAFGLNITKPMLVPSGVATYTKEVTENIKACKVLQEIANTKFDPNVIKDGLHVRMKQSSLLQTSKLYNDMMVIVKDVYYKMEQFAPPKLYSDIFKTYINILETSTDYNTLIQLLERHNTFCIDQIRDYINDRQSSAIELAKLAGEIFTNTVMEE